MSALGDARDRLHTAGDDAHNAWLRVLAARSTAERKAAKDDLALKRAEHEAAAIAFVVELQAARDVSLRTSCHACTASATHIDASEPWCAAHAPDGASPIVHRPV